MEEIICLLSTTFEKKNDAEEMAEKLLDQDLIACAQINGPMTSLYRWQGKVEQEQEYNLEVKTFNKHVEKVTEIILQLHPYDTPELLKKQVASCNEQYSQWMNEVIK